MKKLTIIASRPMSAFSGIAIYAIDYDINDSVLVGDEYNGVTTVPRWSRIRYNAHDEPYFMHHGRREYLSEYMRH